MPELQPSTDESYRYCRQVVGRAGSNFALSFLLLPQSQRRAMYALYAFAREVDDLADSLTPVADRRIALDQFSEQFEAALSGSIAGRLMPAVIDTIHRFSVPSQYFRDIVAGVRMDLDHRGFDTFDDLKTYCLHVASAVGLACLPIWRVADESGARQPAIDCGIAFQLTNIVRDVHEDAQLGRMYLPREDLTKFGCDAEDLFDLAHRERVVELLRFECARAADYYRSAARLEQYLSGRPKRVFALMFGRYAALLKLIQRDEKAVLSRKLRLTFAQKLLVAGRAVASRPVVPPPVA